MFLKNFHRLVQRFPRKLFPKDTVLSRKFESHRRWPTTTFSVCPIWNNFQFRETSLSRKLFDRDLYKTSDLCPVVSNCQDHPSKMHRTQPSPISECQLVWRVHLNNFWLKENASLLPFCCALCCGCVLLLPVGGCLSHPKPDSRMWFEGMNGGSPTTTASDRP